MTVMTMMKGKMHRHCLALADVGGVAVPGSAAALSQARACAIPPRSHAIRHPDVLQSRLRVHSPGHFSSLFFAPASYGLRLKVRTVQPKVCHAQY
eukprot:252518-Rhodomonas_salina.1